ncbi:MAG TPA: enoyl-CoA hydratase/isomerase family protein [Thermoleophilaceae bacterium]
MPIVEIHDAGAVRHIVMSRAEKRNALNEELILGLAEAFEEAAADETVRAVVLKGDGPMFSAGMDLGSLKALSENPELIHETREPILKAWNLLEEMPKATIAQIHGGAIGGAMELALACDLRVMAEDAVVGLVETRIGLIPDVGGCSRLPAVVGLGNAKELIMTGKLIEGREAHRIGFANRIAPVGLLDGVTEQLTNELLACAPQAVALAKRVMDAAAKPDLKNSLDREVEAQAQLAASQDFAEGAQAFQEKRQPAYVSS